MKNARGFQASRLIDLIVVKRNGLFEYQTII